MKNIILVIIANLVCCITSLQTVHAQNVIDDKNWGYTNGAEFGGGPILSNGYYLVRSALYPFGPNKNALNNPKMYLARDSEGYILTVRIVFEDAPWKHNLSVGSTLKLMSISGDTVVLQKHPLGYFSKFRWLSEPLRGVNWAGPQLVKGYCVDFQYEVNNIDSLLSHNYCGFDMADGFYIQNFSDNPKRVKSFNRDMKDAKRNVDRRVKTAVYKKSALYYPSDY